MNRVDLPLNDEALASRGATRSRSIGAILVDAGYLTSKNAERILREQQLHGKRFGDAAITLGLLSEEELSFALSSQFDYPYLPASDPSLSQELVAAYKPFSPAVEQLRALRSQLILRGFNTEADHTSLAIVSPGKGDGRSFIAANLAIVFSQLGERTLLIDGNLRTPRLHELFNLGNSSGLSELLAGRSTTDVIVRIPALIGLSMLAAGAVPPNPQELLGRPMFAKTLRSLEQEFDVIIIDTPAAIDYADAQIIASRASTTLILARNNQTSLPDVARLSRSLQDSGTSIVGSMLNDIKN